MFKNYLKIAFRNLYKHKWYSFSNILGLATGIACCIFILLYVQFELSYDRYHEDADRIYRVAKSRKTQAKHDLLAANVIEVASTLKERFPEVVSTGRIGNRGAVRIRAKEQLFVEEKIMLADAGIFDILSIPFIYGDPHSALVRPNSLVLTKHIARRYFGDENPLGNSVTVYTEEDTVISEITGVVEDCPPNTHISFNILKFLDVNNMGPWQRPWNGWHGMNYIKLAEGVDLEEFENKIRRLPHEFIGEQLEKEGIEFTLFLQPITDIHLHSNLSWEAESNGNSLYVYIFSSVGIFILLIACMNFMNLSTARSANRAKEIGMRKIVGAHRRQLVSQFLGESIIITLLAILAAILSVVSFIMPQFNSLAGTQFSLIDILKPIMLMGILAFILIIGVAAGSYPAFFLSAFRPTAVIKGSFKEGARGVLMRKILVVGQFAISITLIIGTLLFLQQLNYMKNQHLGFDKEQKLIIEFDRSLMNPDNYKAVKAEFLKHPSILSTTFSSSVPGRWMYFWTLWPAGERETNSQMVNAFQVDEDFFNEYNIEMVAGRAFDHGMDNIGYIINEAAVQSFGWDRPEQALTHHINRVSRPIIGVMKNFHYRGLQNRVEPVGIFFMHEDFRYLTMKVKTENLDETTAFIEETHKKLFPDALYDYFFLDTDFDLQYRSEERLARIFSVFSFLGIFIACLGLFGLASFMAEQRTKEIGIRKVLGATVAKIVLMLSGEFTKWVLLANVIAWPLAYFAMGKWLQDFAYRIEIGFLPFIISSVLALMIALVTVSYQSIKAGRANPVDSLKYE